MQQRRLWGWGAWFAAVVLCVGPIRVYAQPVPSELSDDDTISIDFENAELQEVITAISLVTGKNFLIDASVKGTVTIIAPRRIPRDQAFQLLQSILELNGFALVPGDNVYKVVQARAAVQKDIPVCVGREPCPGYADDQLITQLVPLRYADATRLTSVLQSLTSRDAAPVAYENTNTIIMTDTAANLRRVLGIITRIDIAGYEQNVTVVPLKHASADQLATTLREALQPAAGGTPTARRPRRAGQPPQTGIESTQSEVRIIPESRTNSLIIVANEIDTQQVMFLLRQLDMQTPVEQNNIHVRSLSNALAPEMAEVLANLAGAQPARAGGDAGQPGQLRTFYQEVSIVADEATNSLLIIATPQDFAVLDRVIERLDVRRSQVLVEVLIAEVSIDFAQSLGIRWGGTIGSGDAGGFVGVDQVSRGGSLASGVLTTPDLPSASTALATGLPPGGTIGALAFDMGILRVFAEANANETNSDFNILSAPHVLTLDNEEARIVVADNVPFVTGTLTDTGGTTGLAQNTTFEFRDVGITLEITPHIAPDRTVRLEIHQEVNELGDVFVTGGEATNTERKREVTTVVLVNDRHTVVIGGLIRETETEAVSKVPILGDIPLLGWLFKSRSLDRTKTNLMVFITPTIVSNLDEAERITQAKRDEIPDRMTEQLEGAGVYQRSKTFRRPARNLPAAEGAAAASPGGASARTLIDAPVK